MAMTKCKECGTEISTTADACPKCGAKQVRTSGCAKVVLWALGFFVFVAIVGQCSRKTSPTDSSPPTSSPSPAAAPATNQGQPASKDLPPVTGTQWSYSQEEDPMGKGTTHYAHVTSTNTVSFSPPYDGAQNATLVLRTHPRHGKDVFLNIEKGQILCRSYENCNVLVRFDDQKAMTYSGRGPADNSTETVFIQNYSKFMAGLLKAKRVRISVDVYQEGAPVFEFDVSGFNEAKYNGK